MKKCPIHTENVLADGPLLTIFVSRKKEKRSVLDNAIYDSLSKYDLERLDCGEMSTRLIHNRMDSVCAYYFITLRD
jgi:hypothetical protein